MSLRTRVARLEAALDEVFHAWLDKLTDNQLERIVRGESIAEVAPIPADVVAKLAWWKEWERRRGAEGIASGRRRADRRTA